MDQANRCHRCEQEPGEELILLWDGNRYCTPCLRSVCPELIEYAKTHPVLREVTPRSLPRIVRFAVCAGTLLFVLIFGAMFLCLCVGAELIVPRAAAAQFHAQANVKDPFAPLGFGRTLLLAWLVCVGVEFVYAAIVALCWLPRTVEVSDGVLRMEPPYEFEVKVSDLQWKRDLVSYDTVHYYWPCFREAVLLRVTPRGWLWITCGLTPEMARIWAGFLTVAKIPTMPRGWWAWVKLQHEMTKRAAEDYA